VDQNLRVFLWALAGAGFFGALGGAFGALAGVVTWTNGRAAGTGMGFAVARAFARIARTELSPAGRGALVGATDGSLFLGFVGVVLGYVAATHGPGGWRILGPAALTALLLACGAVFFGSLAHGLTRAGVWAVVCLFAGGVGGAIGGALLGGLDGIMIGAIAGILAGTALALWRR
jgi:hypothetical protein